MLQYQPSLRKCGHIQIYSNNNNNNNNNNIYLMQLGCHRGSAAVMEK